MKKLLLLGILLGVSGLSSLGAGLVTTTLSPVGAGGGLSSNQIYSMIQTFAPTNGGITAAQAAVQINDTNVNRIQPVVDSKLTITNAFVKWNGGTGTNLNILNMTNRGVSVFDSFILKPWNFYTNIYIGDGPQAALTVSNNDSSSIFHFVNEVAMDTSLTVGGTIAGDGSAITGLNGANITAGSLPVTAADSSWMSITNAVAITNQPTTIGQALVVVGTNVNGATLVKGTNWPTGGGSAFPLAADGNANQFSITNLSSITVRSNQSGLNIEYILKYDSTTLPSSLRMFPNGDLSFAAFNANTIVAQGNGFGGFYQGAFISTNAGVYSKMDSNSVTSGTLNANSGSVSLIPTNASIVLTSNGVIATLPFGVTNSLAGRAQPVVQYYMIDGASGVPLMTASNEATGIKLTKGKGSLASLTETNWFTLPITSTNTIWRIRDESTGSGASVGVISNWLVGL